MKLRFFTCAFASLFIVFDVARAQQKPGGDPLAKHLVPPSLIIAKAEEIGLTEDQRDAVRDLAHAAHRDIAEPQRALQSAYAELSNALAKEPIDEGSAMKKLDQVLDLERKIKRRQLQMLVEANRALKPPQRAKLQALRSSPDKPNEPGHAIEKRLKGKVAQLQKIAEGLAAQGQPHGHIHEMMKGFTSLMEKGKVNEAEELIDATLEKIRGDESAPEKPDGAAVDPDTIRKDIEALRVKEVAWRKVPWKTCLLEGIEASREQDKPIVLWVFIDRPIDDKRC